MTSLKQKRVKLNIKTTTSPKQLKTHEDLLYNLFFYKEKKYNSLQIFESILNKDKSSSFNGYVFEALSRVLMMLKCVIGFDCDVVIEGKIGGNLKETTLKKVSCELIQQGDNASDIITRTGNTYIAFSVKYKNKLGDFRHLGCTEINNEFKKINADYKIGFITRCKNEVINHTYHSKGEDYQVVMEKVLEDGLLFDKETIVSSIDMFLELFKNITLKTSKKHKTSTPLSIKEIIEHVDEKIYNIKRKRLFERFHQTLTLKKFINNYDSRYHLVPHVPRSGKTITLLLMIKHMFEVKHMKRIILFTSVPKTIKQFINEIEKYIEFNTIEYKQQDDTIEEAWEGLYFCSIQYLKNNKEKKMQFLKNMKFEALVSDEAHIGSSTKKSKENIIDINSDFDNIQQSISKVIFASGTPGKTKKFYKILSRNIYEWDYIDNNLMKQENYEYMSSRHGSLFDECFIKINNDKDYYSKYPLQILERFEMNKFFEKEIIHYNNVNNENYGFDFNSLFELVQEIINKKIIYKPKFKLCETTSGKDMLINILNYLINDNPMQRKKTIMDMIERQQYHYGSDKRISTIESPKLFIIYLPTNSQFSNIEPLQQALYSFLKENELWVNYNIEYTNSKSNSLGYKYNDYDIFIETIMNNTSKNKKKGCILFLGEQGTTGITYHDCDVTISMDNGKSLDNEKQKQARAMTDAPNKTIGINIDMNIQRCFSIVVDKCNTFRKIMKKDMTNVEIIKYLRLNKLFVFDSSKLPNLGECHESIITEYYKNIADEMAKSLSDDIYLEDLECEDILHEFIKENDFVSSYTYNRIKNERECLQKEIEELHNGLNPDMPVPGKEKILVEVGEKKKNIETLEADIEEEVAILVNKTLEVMKKWLMSYIIIISIKYKTTNIAAMLDNTTIMKEIINIMLEKKIEFEITTKNIVLIKEAMKTIIENNSDIVNNIREIYENAHPNQYRKLIERHFIPTQDEKKQNAEVPTPIKLVDEMLSKIPENFWCSRGKVFEPCCGKGNFVLGIFYRLFDGLKQSYKTEYECCRAIVENLLYYADISTLNVFITTEILKCEVQSRCGECDFSEWNFNSWVGDTLELDIKKEWGVEGFDAVVGNPPYNSSGDTGTGNTIWQNFTRISLNKLIKKNGYLAYVHPPGWRKPNTQRGKFYGLYKLMSNDNQMLYLSIHGIKDGQQTFNCGTRYDWYLIQKKSKYTTTIINDEKRNEIIVDMNDFNWLPNYNIGTIKKILAKKDEELCPIMYDRTAYGADKKDRVSSKETHEFKYPCVHSTPKSGIRYMYSKVNDRGHFEVSKVIFGESGIYKPVIDMNGKYGMTHGAMAIQVDNLEEATNISKVIESDIFDKIIQSCIFSSFRIDWNIFKEFKKDFWKEFI